MSRWKGLSIIMGCAIFAATLTSCDRQSGQDRPTLRIGMILSESGGAAAYGADAKRGAEVALEMARAEGLPFDVDVVSRDDRSEQTEAANAATALINIDHVNAILGPAISPSALSVGRLAQENGVPMVVTSATLDSITRTDEYDRTFVFRACFNDTFQGQAMASFVFNSLQDRTAAIVYDSSLPYSVGLSRAFRADFERLGGRVVSQDTYSSTDTDFSALITRTARVDADVLFIPGWDEHVGPMIRQAAGRWNKFTLIGGDGWPTDRLLQLAGPVIPEAYALSHFQPENPSPQAAAFIEAYRARFGSNPTPFAALGYDAMRLILDAAKRASSLERESLRASLAATRELPLATGTFSFDETRSARKEASIVAITPQGFTLRERVRP